MKHSLYTSVVRGLATAGLLCGAVTLFAADACCEAAKPYVGRWALTIPGGGAGWLGIEPQADGTLKGSILWGGGSVVPTAETKVENGALKSIIAGGAPAAGWGLCPAGIATFGRAAPP